MRTRPAITSKKRPLAKNLERKPCPTCYLPMRLEGDGWVCEKHGKPERP